jgi:hypothetical protein
MLDEIAVTGAVVAKLGDWAGLMGRRVGPARQLLRHLLVGRIAFTPQADGLVQFVGYATLGPLVAGTVLAGLSKAGVSPTGHVSGALLVRAYLLVHAYAALRFQACGEWRVTSSS